MTKILIDRAVVEQALEALEAMQSYAAAERKGLRICDEAVTTLRAVVAEPDIDPVDEYRKGFIDGQIDMRDRPEEQQDTPLKHEYEVTANDDGTFSVELPDGEELRIIPPQRPAEPEGGGNLPPPLQVPTEVAATLTTTDIAWLSTHRLVKLWKELGQMRWAGADEGWDRAIEEVRSRLNDECQAVMDWKLTADKSQATAVELLQKMQGLKND